MPFKYIQTYNYSVSPQKDKVMLLTHGFNSTKEEVKGFFLFLAETLSRRGVSSFSPDLFYEPGVLLSLQQQYEIVKEAVKFLISEAYQKIYICGFSLGAYLAMKAAYEFEFEKVFLLSPVFSLKEDFTNFLGFKIPEMIREAKDFVVFYQEGVGSIRLPKDFLFEISSEINNFNIKKGNLTLISGADDFSALNHEKIKASQSPNVTFTSHIFPSTDHIFNAFNTNTQKLNAVGSLIAEGIE